jgi:ketosteroid isomerase-like protein
MMGRDHNSEIRQIFADYSAGFDDADADQVTALFAYPATIWQFGEGHVFDDEEDLAENVEALVEVFDEAGIVLTTATVNQIVVHGTSAFASVAWRQENEAGEAMQEFTCHYMLIHADEGWRIATIINEAETGLDG